jgi:hypothetical protein
MAPLPLARQHRIGVAREHQRRKRCSAEVAHQAQNQATQGEGPIHSRTFTGRGFKRLCDHDGDRRVGVTNPVVLQEIEPKPGEIRSFIRILRERRPVRSPRQRPDGLLRSRHRERRRARARCSTRQAPHKACRADEAGQRSSRLPPGKCDAFAANPPSNVQLVGVYLGTFRELCGIGGPFYVDLPHLKTSAKQSKIVTPLLNTFFREVDVGDLGAACR